MQVRLFPKKRVLVLLIAILAVVMGHFRQQARQEPFFATVVSVSDGDTATVEKTDHQRVKIRFYGIDAPELSQPYGEQAKRFTDDLIYQKRVEIFPKDYDKYERIVAVVKIGDKVANEEIVSAGYAWWYNSFAPDYRELKDAQRNACEKHIGLWSERNPVPPWEWRQTHHRDAR